MRNAVTYRPIFTYSEILFFFFFCSHLITDVTRPHSLMSLVAITSIFLSSAMYSPSWRLGNITMATADDVIRLFLPMVIWKEWVVFQLFATPLSFQCPWYELSKKWESQHDKGDASKEQKRRGPSQVTDKVPWYDRAQAIPDAFIQSFHYTWNRTKRKTGQELRSSLSINALRACVSIYIRQPSSFRAPTLWFIDLTVATCHTLCFFILFP